MGEREYITVAETSDGPGGSRPPGEEVTLPVVELLTGRGFITGKSGSGKSNSASVVAERLLDAGFGMLIVDIDGEYYGLKEAYEILHVGGDEECDIQVTTEHAEKLATLALEGNVPIILDVSSYLDEAEAEALLTAVARNLFAKAKKQKQPFLMLVEEVHEYIPEKGSVGECGQMLIKIGKRGRKHGLGLCGISQRPADVKKDFITQCDWMLWHRLTWKNDTGVVRRILDGEYADAVENLDDGEGFLVSDWAEAVRRVQFYRKETFDAGATPGLEDFERPELKSVSDDLVAELEQISEADEKRQNRIAELESRLEQRERRIEELEQELREARDLRQLAEQFVTAFESDAAERLDTAGDTEASVAADTDADTVGDTDAGVAADTGDDTEADSENDKPGDTEDGTAARAAGADGESVDGRDAVADAGEQRADGTTVSTAGDETERTETASVPLVGTPRTDDKATDEAVSKDEHTAQSEETTAQAASADQGRDPMEWPGGWREGATTATDGSGNTGAGATRARDSVVDGPTPGSVDDPEEGDTDEQLDARRLLDRLRDAPGPPDEDDDTAERPGAEQRIETVDPEVTQSNGADEDESNVTASDVAPEDAVLPSGEPRVVWELKSELDGIEERAQRMLEFYREHGPATPQNAHFAAGGDGDRTEAYAHNRTLRTSELIDHVGRGRYDYNVPDLLAEEFGDHIDESVVEAYVTDVETTVFE